MVIELSKISGKVVAGLTVAATLVIVLLTTVNTHHNNVIPAAPHLIDYAQTVGPKAGHLVLVGGGKIGADIIKKFIALAGGHRAKIVFIPTAEDDGEISTNGTSINLFTKSAGTMTDMLGENESVIPQTFYRYGAQMVTILHTRAPKDADKKSFVAPLTTATGVWFTGGRQWRLSDAYLNTRTQTELVSLLNRGGVIGGTSAGATIQGSYLVRGSTSSNAVVEGNRTIGFGFIKNSAIDQHVLVRHRVYDLIPLIEENPSLLGIGLDEQTAIIVHADRFEVIGKSVVAITDARRLDMRTQSISKNAASKSIYFVGNAQWFDLVKRSILN